MATYSSSSCNVNAAVSSPRSPKTVDAQCMAPELAAASCVCGDGRGPGHEASVAGWPLREPEDVGASGVVGATLDPEELEEELDSDSSELQEELELELELVAELFELCLRKLSTT